MVEVTGNNYTYDESRIKMKQSTNVNQPLLKLLVPNYVAGALIGKGGTLMTEMREKFGGNIRLSANRQCYPATNERIIILTGENNEIADLNNYIMEKVQDVPAKQPIDESRRDKVKIVLTNAAAGLLIGRGGLTIKTIQEESKAKISICSIEAAAYPGERVLTMSGTMDQRKEACQQIIQKISSDASNMANTNLKYVDGGIALNLGLPTAGNPMNPGRNLGRNSGQDIGVGPFGIRQQESYNPFSGNQLGLGNMGLSNQSSGTKLKAKVEIQMEVPNVLVGPILGKGGDIIRDLVQRSGARFKFSDKDEYAPGTTDRILTISANDMGQAQTAFSLINERIEQVGSQLHLR